MKLRMRFGKEGIVKFIGHLDIMRYFQKAFRRANVDITYSQGYHPHPCLSFASPLGVGLESRGEYLDMEVNSFDDLEAMKNAVNAQMVEGIVVYSIRHLPDQAKNAMSIIAAADYEVGFREEMAPCETKQLKAAVESFMSRPEIRVIKKTKKSEREIDIRPLIYQMVVQENGKIFMQVAAGSATNLKPELVMQTLCRLENLEENDYAWLVTRCDMYADKGNEQTGRHLVSLEDFARRMQGSDLNKRAVENLIKCGAMDGLGMGRGQMLAIYEMVLDAAADTYRRNLEGQLQLFGPEDGGMPEIPAPKLPPLRPAELMQMEKETVGLYLSGHPLDEYRTRLRAAGVTPILRILQSFEENDGFFHDGQNVRIAGMVEEIRRKTTRNGSMMAYVTLEDDTAAMELLTFSNVLERSGSLLTENAAVVAEGRISVRDEKAPQLVVNRFDPLESFTKQAPPPMAAAPRPAAQEQAVLQASRLYLRLPSEQSPLFGKVRATLNMFPGNVAAVLYFADTGVRRGTQCGLRGDMLQELRALLGEDSVVLK